MVGGCCIRICVTCCMGRVVRTTGVPIGTAVVGCSFTTAVVRWIEVVVVRRGGTGLTVVATYCGAAALVKTTDDAVVVVTGVVITAVV